MLGRTHLGVGLVVGYGLCLAMNIPNAEATPIMVSTAIGSLLPDIDHPQSSIGGKIKIISLPLNHFVGHRGITHSLLFAVAMFALLGSIGYQAEAIGIAVGILSHLFLDMLNPSGVPLLYPIKQRFHLMNIETGSGREKRMFWLFILIVIALVVYRP